MNKSVKPIEPFFDAEYYLASNSDVVAAGIDPMEHYRTYGWRELRAPTRWFDPVAYLRRHPELQDSNIDPFAHFITHNDPENAMRTFEAAGAPTEKGAMGQLMAGRSSLTGQPDVYQLATPSKADVETTAPFFDTAYYLANNPDIARSLVDPLLHFLTIGWIEGRDPSPDFSVRYYLMRNKDVCKARLNPFVHYCKHGSKERWRDSAGVAEAAVLEAFATNETLLATIREATALEPMITFPDNRRTVNIPVRMCRDLMQAAGDLRFAMRGRTYSHVVLVPHIRMSGAARVSAIFSRILAEIARERVLVVCTDGSDTEYRHWFGENCDIFDASAIMSKVGGSLNEQLLYDLLRGVEAKAFYNVNSRLAWQMLETYGRQLFQEFTVFTYLFTWDETVSGARVGYPIQWLRNTSAHHHVIFTDNQMLAHDITTRFGYDGDERCKVIALRTPVTPVTEVTLPTTVQARPIFLWAGRFDRQKRTDLLVEIMKASPQALFHVYGKAVLEEHELIQENVPDNCILKGTYQNLAEVFKNETYAGFLYTAQWDGMPTILLDMGSIGLPIIAPDVGGIGEVVNNGTGWLIDPPDDVTAYAKAIEQISEDPAEAAQRAAAMRKFLGTAFSADQYVEAVKGVLQRDGL